jgi:solute carrier family 35 protein E1
MTTPRIQRVAVRANNHRVCSAAPSVSSPLELDRYKSRLNHSSTGDVSSRSRSSSVIVKASSSNPIETIKEKFPQAETVFYFAAWYFLNVQFNILNKQIYNYFPFPWFVSCVHLIVGLGVMGFFWGSKIVEYEQPDKDFLKALSLPAFLHAFGHCLTNVSFAAVAVSFTHTVKTLEPVFTSIGAYMVTGTVYPLPVYLSLIPIMAGVAIASATELSFTWLGFLTAMSSNVAFSARAIFSKKLMAKMTPLNLYNWVTIVALLFCLPFAFYFEGATVSAGISKAIALKGKQEFFTALALVGFYYHMYNQVAYQALGKVAPVTHAVGNVGKRVFVIGFSILALGNQISTQTAIGSAIAVLGAGLYGVVKSKTQDKH